MVPLTIIRPRDPRTFEGSSVWIRRGFRSRGQSILYCARMLIEQKLFEIGVYRTAILKLLRVDTRFTSENVLAQSPQNAPRAACMRPTRFRPHRS